MLIRCNSPAAGWPPVCFQSPCVTCTRLTNCYRSKISQIPHACSLPFAQIARRTRMLLPESERRLPLTSLPFPLRDVSMRLCWLLMALAALALPNDICAEDAKRAPMRAQVTVDNWDKGGPLSHWVYTHLSEVFPAAVVRRAGPIVDLPAQLRPEIGGLKLKNDDGSEQTLDQFINNGAVDGCIV